MNRWNKIFILAAFMLLGRAWGEQAFIYSPSAKVIYWHGTVTVTHNALSNRVTGKTVLHEGDSLKTAADGYCVIQLEDGQKLSVNANNEVTLWVFFKTQRTGSWRASLKAFKHGIVTPFNVFWKVKKKGLDFEDESSNTLAATKG